MVYPCFGSRRSQVRILPPRHKQKRTYGEICKSFFVCVGVYVTFFWASVGLKSSPQLNPLLQTRKL